MDTLTIIYIYIYMWIVYAAALVEELSFKDVISSAIAGLVWPVGLPARIIRKMIE